MYNDIILNGNIIRNDYQIMHHFVDGAFVEIKSPIKKNFRVEFWNKNNYCEYSTTLSSNSWAKTNKKYFEEYTLKVYDETNKIVFDKKYNANGKRVFIALDSKALGDTLAWFPYVEEFRKKWDCEVICSTFWNNLFEKNYPKIQFVNPGVVVHNLYAMYRIGWYYNNGDINYDHTPIDYREQNLQYTACAQLGLDFKQIRAKLDIPQVEKLNRVAIGIHGTAQTKYWNNPTGWQELTDYLSQNGHETIIVSKENDGYMGNNHPKGAIKLPEGSIENLIKEMVSCKFFVGIGSGLSWLAWTLGVPTVLISGFSKPYSEFSGENVYRIFNENVCNGCFNTHKLDPGDWNWCPEHKGTPRQFECTKTITFDMIKPHIERLLKA